MAPVSSGRAIAIKVDKTLTGNAGFSVFITGYK